MRGRGPYKRSIRLIIAYLEILALIAAALIFFVSSTLLRDFAVRDFLMRRSSEISAIDQLLSSRLLLLSRFMELFAATPREELVPFMVTVSDLYRMDADGTIKRVYKQREDSAIFQGYRFGGSALRIISGSYFSTARISSVQRAPENERPSIYVSAPGPDGLFLGRLELEALRDDIHRLVRLDGTIVLIANKDGLPLTTLGDDLPTQIIRHENGETITIGAKDYLVAKGSSSALDVDLVLLTPADQLMNLLTYLDWLFLLGFIILALFLAARLGILDQTLLSPLQRFVASLGAWGPDTPVPEIPKIARGFGELRELSAIFTAKAAEIKALNDSLEHQVVERTEQLAHAMERMIVSEKLAVLGRMAAGVAHELNTPLAAIVSTTGNLADSYSDLKRIILDLFECFDPEELFLFKTLLQAAETGESGRKAIAAFVCRLEELGVADGREIADDLRDIGVPLEDLSLAERIAGQAEGRRIVKAAYSIAQVGKTAAVVSTAAERATMTVRAMKMWVYENRRDATRVSIREELETILTLYYSQTKRNIKIRREYRDGGVVLGNTEQLNSVWVNLINNALQAMEGGGDLTLRIEREAPPSLMVRIDVEDSGCGIPQELQGKVFTPFFTTKPKGAGTGIGLDLSRRMVEAHGGTIGFESRPGRTVFTVRLPAAGE